MSEQHLWINAFVERPLFERAHMEALHRIIKDSLPEWSATLKAAADESMRGSASVGREGNLSEAIQAVAPVRHGLARAVLAGANDKIAFFLSHNQSSLPPELNHIAVEINASKIEDKSAAQWAIAFFENLSIHLPLRYANCHADEEFDEKNMVRDQGSTRSVGTNLDESLPGLYWLNYFGIPYMKLIGSEKLLSTPAYRAMRLGSGVLLQLAEDPSHWSTSASKERELQCMDHLGHSFFFRKNEPHNPTSAPDFRLELKSRVK